MEEKLQRLKGNLRML